MAQADNIFVAVRDGVFADSLRFSLDLEGFETRLCDEHSLLPAMSAAEGQGCLVLDRDVFARVQGTRTFSDTGMPVVLIVPHKTKDVLALAEAAGVTTVVEEPLVGGVLLEAIRHVMRRDRQSGRLPPRLRSFP